MPAKYYGRRGKYAQRGEKSSAAGGGISSIDPSRIGNQDKRQRVIEAQQREAQRIGTIGQFGAGRLSGLQTTKGVNTSVADKIQTRFVDLGGGKTGTIVNAQPQLQDQTFDLNAQRFQQMLDSGQFNQVDFNNPQNAGIFGVPQQQGLLPQPPPFVPNAAQDARGTLMDQVTADIYNANVFEQVMGITGFGVLGKVSKVPKALKTLGTAGKIEGKLSGNQKIAETVKKILGKMWYKTTNSQKTVTYVSQSGKTVTKTIQEISRNPRISLGKLTVLGTLGVAGALIVSSLGGRNFGNFLGQEENYQGVSFHTDQYAREGEFDLYWESRALEDEALDFESGNIPIKNVADSLEKYESVQKRNGELRDEFVRRLQEKAAAGEEVDLASAEFWKNYHAEVEANKTAEEKARVDYYKKVEQEISRARSDANKENAEFWLAYRKKIFEMEAAEREKQAEFWLEYRKMILKMQEESRGSSLNFGLLR